MQEREISCIHGPSGITNLEIVILLADPALAASE
jgi:hypothetical protein